MLIRDYLGRKTDTGEHHLVSIQSIVDLTIGREYQISIVDFGGLQCKERVLVYPPQQNKISQEVAKYVPLSLRNLELPERSPSSAFSFYT